MVKSVFAKNSLYVYAIYSFCYNFFKKSIFVNVKLIFQSRIFKLIALNTSSVQISDASID